MKCEKCGALLREGSKYCRVCGAQPPLKATVLVERTREKTPRENNTKTVLIAMVSLLVAGLVAISGYFAVIALKNHDTTKKCSSCNKEISGSSQICDECELKNETMEEVTIDKTADEENEKIERTCNICGEVIVTAGDVCVECMEQIDERFYDGEYTCAFCKNEIEEADMSWIDEFGLVYCKACDNGKYCESCNAVLSESDDDSVCRFCADYVCKTCEEVLGEDKIKAEDNYYCESCFEELEMKVCGKCGIELSENDDDELCSDCAELVCEKCGEVLSEDDEKEERDDKVYCADCAKTLDDDADKDGVILCYKCYKGISADEVSCRDEAGLTYCKTCDTGHYCKECGEPISKKQTYCRFCEDH